MQLTQNKVQMQKQPTDFYRSINSWTHIWLVLSSSDEWLQYIYIYNGKNKESIYALQEKIWDGSVKQNDELNTSENQQRKITTEWLR